MVSLFSLSHTHSHTHTHRHGVLSVPPSPPDSPASDSPLSSPEAHHRQVASGMKSAPSLSLGLSAFHEDLSSKLSNMDRTAPPVLLPEPSPSLVRSKVSKQMSGMDITLPENISTRASKSLLAFSKDVTLWVISEAEKIAREKDPENPVITSLIVSQVIEALLCVRPSSLPMVTSRYQAGIRDAVQKFFDLLHFADWKYVTTKSDVHVMRVEDPKLLCVRYVYFFF